MVGQRGRPIAAGLEDFVATHPEVKPELTGTGEDCNGFFDPSGALVEETFDLLNASIDAYEGEQLRRCGAVPQCRTTAVCVPPTPRWRERFRRMGTTSAFAVRRRRPNWSGPSSWRCSDSRTPPPLPPCHQPNSKADTSTNPTIGTARSEPRLIPTTRSRSRPHRTADRSAGSLQGLSVPMQSRVPPRMRAPNATGFALTRQNGMCVASFRVD